MMEATQWKCIGHPMACGGTSEILNCKKGFVEVYKGKVYHADIIISPQKRVWVCGDKMQVNKNLQKGLYQYSVNCENLPISEKLAIKVMQMKKDECRRIVEEIPESTECCKLAKERALQIFGS